MDTSEQKPRRQFLKNTSLAALAIGIIPLAGKAKPATPNVSEKVFHQPLIIMVKDPFILIIHLILFTVS